MTSAITGFSVLQREFRENEGQSTRNKKVSSGSLARRPTVPKKHPTSLGVPHIRAARLHFIGVLREELRRVLSEMERKQNYKHIEARNSIVAWRLPLARGKARKTRQTPEMSSRR
jgi:hypothetical protein